MGHARMVVPFMVLAAACAPAGSDSAERLFEAGVPGGIEVASSAFRAGEAIPERFTCGGEGLSPALAWSGIPAGAVELAVVVDDPDAPGGTYVHWVVYALDPSLAGLEEGALPAGARQAKNSAGRPGYQPPCPPGGAEHRYRFAVYALTEASPFPDGAGGAEVLEFIGGAALAGGVLVARFARD